MATNFPGSLDDTGSLPNPGPGNNTDAPSLSTGQTNQNDAIRAVEAKIGVGASTPVNNRVLRGTGTGTSAWAQLNVTTDVTGTLQAANGGTGVTSLGSGISAFLSTPSSSNLISAVTDETGTGSLVFATSPTIVTPTVASFTNAQHNHNNAAGGGQLNGATALTTGSVDSTRINFGGSGAGVWWEEIGRASLSVAGDTITISSLPARKYLQLRAFLLPTGGQIRTLVRFNNDSSNLYAARNSINGGAESTSNTFSIMILDDSEASTRLVVLEIDNVATQEKIAVGQITSNAGGGAGAVPQRWVCAGKWVNTTDQINRIDVVNGGGGDFAIGSEVVILGHD